MQSSKGLCFFLSLGCCGWLQHTESLAYSPWSLRAGDGDGDGDEHHSLPALQFSLEHCTIKTRHFLSVVCASKSEWSKRLCHNLCSLSLARQRPHLCLGIADEVLKKCLVVLYLCPSSIMHCKFNYNAFITNSLLAMIYLPKMVTIIHFYHYLPQVKW